MKHLKANLWSIAAILCLIAAASAWILNHAEASFVLATLGILAWFLNLRRDFQAANAAREAQLNSSTEQEP